LQEFDGYVVGEKGAPGIVVVQEWWVVDYEIKKHAINIASKGYWAPIPEYVILFPHCPYGSSFSFQAEQQKSLTPLR
jgi:dienelactone hydrolase